MFWTIIIALLAIGSLALFIAATKATDPKLTRIVATVLVVCAMVGTLLSTFYSQDAGEARVQRSFTGELVGETTTAGAHWKAPWVSTITFDVRNNTVTYIGTGKEGDHSGGNATGSQITFQDRDGVTGNMDLVVRYSVRGDSVLDIYKEFTNQESFVSKVVTTDVRSVSRNVPSTYGTLQVLNQRAEIEDKIAQALADRWADDGLIVEEVSLQEIRYSDDTRQRFDDAQAARIAVDKAKADQDKARVEADTKKIEAQGIADANRVLSQSLTDQVLQQKYIDALREAKAVYVVPEGSTPMVATK